MTPIYPDVFGRGEAGVCCKNLCAFVAEMKSVNPALFLTAISRRRPPSLARIAEEAIQCLCGVQLGVITRLLPHPSTSNKTHWRCAAEQSKAEAANDSQRLF